MFKNLLKTLQKHQQRRVEYWQLNNLSDQMLKDIGVSRSEIKYRFYNGKEINS
jgi:uncharacterized protein YjiS (DUF1127 family)